MTDYTTGNEFWPINSNVGYSHTNAANFAGKMHATKLMYRFYHSIHPHTAVSNKSLL